MKWLLIILQKEILYYDNIRITEKASRNVRKVWRC